MKRIFYFLIFAVFLITSCTEEETPKSYLSGTYENVGTNTETGISYVSQYIFRADGTYERISLFKKDGQLLGYQYYSKGVYTLRGNDFSKRETESGGVNVEKYPDGYVELLDELEDNGFNPNESKGTLRQIDLGKKIAILMECNDLIRFSSLCIGELIYDKVD